MSNSPVLWGPNSISNSLQNQQLMANGALLAWDGPKNYITLGNFENQLTTGWSLGTVGTLTNGIPTGSPTFGSGASGNLSIAVTTSSPLGGLASLQYISSAVTTQGNMLGSQAYSIDIEDQAKVLTFKFYYSVPSGVTNCNFSGTSSNSFGIAIWDATNSAWLSSTANFGMTQSSGTGYVTGTCQTATTTASIQFVIYNANATGGAATLNLDDFFLGPQTAPFGPTMTDWVAYTPTFTAFGTVSGVSAFYRRVGANLEVKGTFTSGTSTAANAQISLPSGLSLNSSAITTPAQTNTFGFITRAIHTTATNFPGTTVGPWPITDATATSTTSVFIATTTNTASNVYPLALGTAVLSVNDEASFQFTCPISGWSSNVQMSSDTDTRVVAMRSNNASATVTASYSTVTWNTVINDTHGAMGSTTYTIPVTGYYDVAAQTSLGGTQALNGTASISINKNGSLIQENNNGYGGAVTATNTISIGLDSMLCNAGDTILIQVKSSATLPVIADATNGCFFSISRRSGPSVIAATESVNMSYTDTSGGTIGASQAVYKFTTKTRDTHNAYSTSTGLYTIPVSGEYRISSTLTTAAVNNSTSQAFEIWAVYNGSTNIATNFTWGNGVSHTQPAALSASYPCNAGDTLQIQASSSTATTGSTGAGLNTICIERVGN